MDAKTQQSQSQTLLTTRQAANYLGIKANSLITWRCTKAVRLPYVKIGGCVRYHKSELDEFIEDNSYE